LQPNFEARIGLTPEDAGEEDDAALSYKYVLGVNMELGEKPGSLGFVSFGPEFFGIQLSGLNAEFEVAGEDKVATLAVVSAVSREVTDEAQKLRDENYTPPTVKAGKDKLVDISVEASGKAGGFVELDADPLGNNRFSNFGYVLEGQLIADGFARWDATPALEAMGYVGPVLKTLKSLGIAKLTTYGRIAYTIGGKATYEGKTIYPKPKVGATQTGEPPITWDMVGGIEHSLAFTMIFRGAVGLEVKSEFLTFGTARGKALLQIGAPTGASDTDGVFI